MQKSLLSVVFCLLSVFVFAQDADSVSFVSAGWQKQKIKYKVQFFKHHFNAKDLFASTQNISYVEVKGKCFAPKLSIGYEKQDLITTSDFGKKYNAAVALNGSFFNVKNGGSVNYLKINDVVIDTSELSAGRLGQRQTAAVAIDKKGRLHIVAFDAANNWGKEIGFPDVLATGPLLLMHGESLKLSDEKFNTARHPRTAAGVRKDGTAILLTVDGRNANAQGADMWELQKIMRWLGCVSAVNLDGGGSTTLWIRGFPDNGVVNYPCDNKQWDHFGERKVSNVLLVK